MLSKNTIAAIDLGSNSFHMVVAEENQGQLVILDRLREMVRLAEGLNGKGRLDSEVEQRALESLSRLGERIRTLDASCVSTVGTNTLRRIKNADDFIFHAEQALGFPIEIISGIEEARLIYQGVSHTLEHDQQSRLIVDIGGGSTELIIGEGFAPKLMNSLEMGCVMMMQAFFDDGKIKSRRIQDARIFVLQRMKDVRYAYVRTGWDVVIGSSGSVKSIANVIHAMELAQDGVITRKALSKLLAICSEYKKVKKLDFPGLGERRKAVFLGGLIILSGLFEALDIETMQVSQGALREGLLYDMVGRRQNNDIRNKSITSLSSRFHSDQQHAQRIEQTAFDFFQQLQDVWFGDLQHAMNLLRWACEVHEIGRNISHLSFQKHSAYIIENADLAGFSREEQRRLASIVRVHRGKLNAGIFKERHQDIHLMLVQLAVVLRLSVIFHRSRTNNVLPVIGVSVSGNDLFLKLPDRWLNEHPLTINDLQQEADYLKLVGLILHTERML
ncbi:Exopolyphosphatase [hydrothermal vent metagenome]|uniref:Exopolyphosphatase n=1 Tax=hydrothermal vent metagenome TaxID=652676 RepID=A0A3B0XKW3_9ZZZZ